MALIKCTECGQMVSERASQCPNCGCPVEKKIVCEECGGNVSPHDIICPNCGCPVTTKKDNDNMDTLPNQRGKAGMIKYFIAIVSYIVLTVIGCALLEESYPTYISPYIRAQNEALCCALVTMFLVLIFARRFIDKFVLCILVTIILFICIAKMKFLGIGAAVILHLVNITSIIISIYKGQSPTIFPYLDSINGWFPKTLLCIAGFYGYFVIFLFLGTFSDMIDGTQRNESISILSVILSVLLSFLFPVLMIILARKLSKKTKKR